MSTENFFVSYDLNGQRPTHKEMDDHLKKLGQCTLRVLETVWFVRYPGAAESLYTYVKGIVSDNDRVLVIEGASAYWRNLLVADDKLKGCWKP